LGRWDGWVDDVGRADGCDLVVSLGGAGVAVDGKGFLRASTAGVRAVRQKDVFNWVWYGNVQGWMAVPAIHVAWRVMVWYLGAKSGCGPSAYGRL
jgi:hypothetical protein